jgi:hypothetical protein
MEYNQIVIAACADELEKIAGIGNFLIKGIKGWQGAFSGAANAAKGIKGAKSWGSHVGTIKKLYGQGASKGGWWGGVKRVARSPYGAMGATAGIGGLAAYGGYKALPNFGGNQQQRGY